MAIVVAVAALGVAVLARLDNQLEDALDRSLRARATEVARLSASTPELLTRPGRSRAGSAAARCSCR